jgi:hypothetical protein
VLTLGKAKSSIALTEAAWPRSIPSSLFFVAHSENNSVAGLVLMACRLMGIS